MTNNDLKSNLYDLAHKRIADAKKKCISNYCRNRSGAFWESLWKYENGKIMQKTCCSGLFNDWHTFETEDLALNSMIKELETIEKVRAVD